MKYRLLKSLCREASVLGMGCAPLLSREGRKASLRALETAWDLGINFFDTADSYGQGGSETLLGEVFQGRREKVIFCTKVGLAYSANLQRAQWLKAIARPLVRRFRGLKKAAAKVVAGPPRAESELFATQRLEAALETSLRRLRTGHIDIYLLHNPSLEILRRGEPFSFLEKAKKQGKIVSYGVSCANAEEGLAALQYPGVSLLQLEVNWLAQDAVSQLLPLAAAKGIDIVARAPFANGRIFESDFAPPVPLPKTAEEGERNRLLTEQALTFVTRLKGVTIVLPSMASPAHLKDNASIIDSILSTERAIA